VRDQTFSKRLIKCWAIINDVEYDIIQITAEFSLNSIPTATATLALGRDVDTLDQGAKTKSVSAKVNEMFLFRNPIKIFASSKIQSESPDLAEQDLSLPSFEGKCIFDGYIAGFGFQRTASSAVLSISIEHWLADLTASTMLSSSTHYGTPVDLQKAALFWQGDTAGETEEGKPALVLDTWINNATGGSAAIIDDLWETGLKRIFTKASDSDNLADLGRNLPCPADQANKLNNVAKNALLRMTSKNAPLKIRTYSADGADIAKNISNDFTNLLMEGLAGQTMWDCLIACSGNYMFAVAPGIGITQVVPYCPTVSTDPAFKKISDSQMESVSISGDCPRTLRGVALIIPQEVFNYTEEGAPGAPLATTVVASYLNPSLNCKGVVLYKHTPAWLGVNASNFTGNDNLYLPPSTVSPTPKAPAAGATVKEKSDKLKSVKDAYAKALYGMEVIKGRQGTISGPLRFDIGVGSVIEFELPTDYHTESTVENTYFYGMVVRVSYAIDANSGTASTTFTVAHVRTFAEEFADGFISKNEGHPMYENSWFGSALDAQS